MKIVMNFRVDAPGGTRPLGVSVVCVTNYIFNVYFHFIVFFALYIVI